MNSLPTNTLPCIINERTFYVSKGSTILQACEQSGFLIPRFCYHDRLSIAGNCRMCLVQLDKATKPVASCALEVSSGMRIFTNTAIVKKAREGVMEFLLANHPLDCPICDQGGECDLQDQALVFGNDRGRFYETKRSVSDKDWGHLIKTVMTRCIHCTRCQRFSSELSGQVEIGMVGRGNKSEITNFLGNLVRSEVSGNVIDLCPVGALTSKPYAFTARPWELSRNDGVDLTDALGSSLSFHVVHQRVVRVLPVLHQRLNEEWLSDRARFVYDGYRLQRLAVPAYVSDDQINSLSWSTALFSALFSIGPFFSFLALFGELSVQSAFFLKKLTSFSSFDKKFVSLDDDQRGSFTVHPSYDSIFSSDLVIIAGVPLKRDLSLLLLRLRLEQNRRDLPILTFGCSDFGLKTTSVGATFVDLLSFFYGKHTNSSLLKRAKSPVFVVAGSFSGFGSNFLTYVRALCVRANMRTIYVPVPSAGVSLNSAAEVGSITPASFLPLSSSFSSLFLNSTPTQIKGLVGTESSFYIGSHGFDSLIRPNLLLLPVLNSLESSSYYLNIEGRLQLSRRVLTSIQGKSMENVLVLLLTLFTNTPFKSLGLDLEKNSATCFSGHVSLLQLKTVSPVSFFSSVYSFYQTVPVTYVSPLLLKSARLQRTVDCLSFPSF
jgi:NADH-quinone oxidoreductase chain G